MTGLIDVSILLIERRNPPKFLLLFLSVNQRRRCLSLLKERVRRVRRVRRRRRRRRRRGVKGERKWYLPLSMLLLL
jgi:hypothetical protein